MRLALCNKIVSSETLVLSKRDHLRVKLVFDFHCMRLLLLHLSVTIVTVEKLDDPEALLQGRRRVNIVSSSVVPV